MIFSESVEQILNGVRGNKDIMGLLMGKKAVITGGGSGIGFAIAKKYHEKGANILITGRNEEKMLKACAEIGASAQYMLWDIRDFDNCRENIERAAKMLGGPIEILVNNAGVLTQNDFEWKYLDITPKEWDYVMDTNCKGMFFMCQNMAKHMLENNIKGHILNITSEMGFRPACVTYGISKWGAVGLTKGLGMMLASRNIVVNGIAPGAITTKMMRWKEGDSVRRESHANKRFGFPGEIADLAVFLGSDKADNIVGEVILSDGGSSLH